MKRTLHLGFWLALAMGQAHAEIYSHVDPVNGMTVLNNMPPGRAPAPTPLRFAAAHFPRISSVQQKEMDVTRRTILATELDSEQQALASAAKARAAGDVLARHANNIVALKRELANVR